MGDPEQTYTHGHHEAVLASHRWRTAENSAPHLLPHLRQKMRVLDIGSGPGTITADLAEIVGPDYVTALEITEEALDLTRSEARSRGLELSYAVGDVHALDFPDDSFDVVHAHQVLQHVADPVAALREMRRVCRPGGIVAVRDSDYSAFAWFPLLPELDRWMDLYQQAARANGGEPDAGRRLLSWTRAAGFTQVEASGAVWCFATDEDRAFWGGMWHRRILVGSFPEQLLRESRSDEQELARLSQAWQRWSEDPDGWYVVPHGQIIARA